MTSVMKLLEKKQTCRDYRVTGSAPCVNNPLHYVHRLG